MKTKGAVSMVDVTNPPIALLAKIGSIVVHADEMTSGDGHELDAEAIRSLLADGEVGNWLRGLEVQYPGVLPKKRRKVCTREDMEKGVYATSKSRGRAGSARSPAKRRPAAKRGQKKS